jgi:hypothetical protein
VLTPLEVSGNASDGLTSQPILEHWHLTPAGKLMQIWGCPLQHLYSVRYQEAELHMSCNLNQEINFSPPSGNLISSRGL